MAGGAGGVRGDKTESMSVGTCVCPSVHVSDLERNER